MTQFNLLPDIKLEFIKVKKTQRLVVFISTVISLVSVAVFVILFVYVKVLQKNHINNLSTQINTASTQISSNTNLNKILTIQNQLISLPRLHDSKPSTAMILSDINQLTPASASISNLSFDFTANTAIIQGNANAIATVNTFVDTLKFTQYLIAGSSQANNAFSSVVLSNFSNSTTTSGLTFNITFSFNPVIFSGTKQITLSVPKIITTRSITQQPTDLFQPKATVGQ